MGWDLWGKDRGQESEPSLGEVTAQLLIQEDRGEDPGLLAGTTEKGGEHFQAPQSGEGTPRATHC